MSGPSQDGPRACHCSTSPTPTGHRLARRRAADDLGLGPARRRSPSSFASLDPAGGSGLDLAAVYSSLPWSRSDHVAVQNRPWPATQLEDTAGRRHNRVVSLELKRAHATTPDSAFGCICRCQTGVGMQCTCWSPISRQHTIFSHMSAANEEGYAPIRCLSMRRHPCCCARPLQKDPRGAAPSACRSGSQLQRHVTP